MIKVAVDAMGGDHAPEEIVKGAILAVQKCKDILVSLVGKTEVIEPLLKDFRNGNEGAQITVVSATEVIETGDHPVEAVRAKKDSSMIVGMKLVREGEAQAFVSAGNSGALMVGAQVVIGRDEGVSRAPFAHEIPHSEGISLLMDCGANVDVRPELLLSFAYLGTRYLEKTYGVENPKVGLVNIGVEKSKGNALTVEAHKLLSEAEGINFIGNVEPTGITTGEADILVCDGFTGNLIIKLYEGLGKLMMGVMKKGLSASVKSKLGALLVKKSLKQEFKPFDAHNYGGAPILGLKGLVIKVHGNAVADEFCNAMLQCVDYLKVEGE